MNTKVNAKPAAKTVKKIDAKKTDPKKVKLPEKYTANTMSAYIAEKHDMSKKQSKELLDDVFALIQSGVMVGERVPVGKMGKVHVKIRPATKARLGRNPLTGEEIKIAAKKATKVPRFTFAKTFKEEVTTAKIKK